MRTDTENANPTPSATIRRPTAEDGAAVWALIRDTARLDDNSMYCNLLQCSHFADTCALAEADGEIVGWVSGYVPPNQPETLFVWQVCVSERARGQGLAKRLIADVLARDICAGVTRVQSTITDANAPSWALFGALAKTLGTELTRAGHFERDIHFAGQHDTEFLVTVGPFAKRDTRRAA